MPERAEVRYSEAGQGFGPRASNIAKRFKQTSTQTVIERRPQDEVLGEWLPENAECDVEEADELGVEESGESDEEEPASMARPRPILPRRWVTSVPTSLASWYMCQLILCYQSRTYKDVQRKMKVEDLHRWLPIMADQYTVYRHTLSGREPPDWEPSFEALHSGSRKKTVVLYDLASWYMCQLILCYQSRTYKDVQRKMKVEDLHRWLPIMADQYTVYRHTLSGREPPDWEPSFEALHSGSRKKTVVLYDLKGMHICLTLHPKKLLFDRTIPASSVSRSVEYYQDYWTSTDCGVSGNFVARGFIPASLLRPVAAFSIELLQWYVNLMKYNKVTPQGFCRALCEPLEEGVSHYR